jgi:hypothetical protein
VVNGPLAARARTLVIVALGLIVVQYITGSATNLYATIPDVVPGTAHGSYFHKVSEGARWALSHSAVELRIHVVLGLILCVLAIAAALLAWVEATRVWKWSTIAALVFLVGAGINGLNFLALGGMNGNSIAMSLCLVGATLAWLTPFVVELRARGATVPPAQ